MRTEKAHRDWDMQKMDCCNFKDLLDSYLCQELAVETNHAMLSHAEHCSTCRCELASRRHLRESLRRACVKDRMSDEACERLRAQLRAEAQNKATQSLNVGGWRDRWANFLNLRFAMPVIATAAVLALVAGAFALYRLSRGGRTDSFISHPSSEELAALQLSDALMTDAADDHRKCVYYVKPDSKSPGMPDTVKDFDQACVGLEKVVAGEVAGLELCSAHVCRVDGRRFAHLIYKRDGQLVSLLVTPRDGEAMKTGQLPLLDATLAGLQETRRDDLALGAYQTSKRVVLVVSGLSESENEKLTRALALPVVAHLRRVENQTAFLKLPGIELIANVRGGELK